MKPIDHYDVLAFDCDGVLLNSNAIKTDAFHEVALGYGEEAANCFRQYHQSNGGISRYKKFDYFFRWILEREPHAGEKEQLLKKYAAHVSSELLRCEVVEGLNELRLRTKKAGWMVASGGDQLELQHVFQVRQLDQFFNLGVFGSPVSKDDILKRAVIASVKGGVDPSKMLVIGDSAFDYHAAKSVGADFVFASYWTEMPQWQDFTTRNGLSSVGSLSEIVLKERS